MAGTTKDKKIGEIEFMPLTFPAEPLTFIFKAWGLADGTYGATIEKHPHNAPLNLPERWYSLGEMIALMNLFKHGRVISNTLPPKIMERARREAILLKLE